MEPAAIWEVIGGKDKGGIMVREGRNLRSKEVAERLAFASFVEEVELVGERLHYKLMAGSGPATGWVSINIGAQMSWVGSLLSTSEIKG